MSQFFHESGICFTDEITDGRPWEALNGGNDDLWSFDAAIIPKALRGYNHNASSPFTIQDSENSLLIINRDVWSEKPWN